MVLIGIIITVIQDRWLRAIYTEHKCLDIAARRTCAKHPEKREPLKKSQLASCRAKKKKTKPCKAALAHQVCGIFTQVKERVF